MQLETIRQYITTHLHDWDQTKTDVDVLYVNHSSVDDIDTSRPFVKLTVDYGNARTVSVDSNHRRRRTGTLTLQCFAPINTGQKKLTLLVDELVSHFEYARSPDRKIWFLTSNVVNVNNERFYQININIDFRASDI